MAWASEGQRKAERVSLNGGFGGNNEGVSAEKKKTSKGSVDGASGRRRLFLYMQDLHNYLFSSQGYVQKAVRWVDKMRNGTKT